jgi:penicillin-binding protein 1C
VGNADGEGRPGLTGTESASPIMFDIFSQLPGNSWFQVPLIELNEVRVCVRSGMRASDLCSETKAIKIPVAGLQSAPCRFHQNVHLSLDGKYRVHADCESITRVKSVSWFVLPPVQEYYFKSRNLSYHTLPAFRNDCVNPALIASMDLIYPKPNARIFIPRELDGQLGSALFEVAHRQANATVYWHLDATYLGATRGTHRLAVAPDPGSHTLTLIDDQGTILDQWFSVAN